jgi:hypothetical protein
MLNIEDLTDRNSLVNHYFRSDRLFDHGNYDTYGLLLLGFMLCRHNNTLAASEALWTIVNPAINATVPREDVKKILEDLCYYAIDLPTSH